MAAPTIRFRLIPQNTPEAAVENPTKRLGTITGQSIISTGVDNEVDFGTIDISGGAANSTVKTMLWDVTANGGNATVETFKEWCSSLGFDQVDSVVKVQPLSGADQVSPSNTKNYIADAVVASYTWAIQDESVPSSQNQWPSNEGSSMDISGGASDDAIMWALYLAIATGETTGTYKGTDAGFGLQWSFKYSYS